MSTQSYPWYKFAHVEYLLDPMISTMSLTAQGANTRLMAYAARQLPFGTLPNDEKKLFAMSGAKSLKQWQKLHTELMGVVWFVNDDNRWFCPLMNVESVPVVEQEAKQEDEPSQDDISAKRSAAAKARWDAKRANDMQNIDANNANNDFASCKTDATDMQSTNLHDAKVMQNDANSNFAYANEGVGGDLDLNQDLDLNKLNTPPNNLTVISSPMPIETVVPVQSEPAQEPVKKTSRKRINIEALTEDDLVNTYGALPRYAKDWLAVRAKKNAPLTPSAMEGVINQAELAGITVAQAIEVCAKKQWQGFNAAWNYSDIISVQKTANDAIQLKGIKALVDSGQSQNAAETFLKGMTDIYGLDLVNESIISAIANKPQDVTEYIGNFLRSRARSKQSAKPVFGSVNSKFPIPTATKLTEAEIRENKEKIDDLPF
jgi:uncharacterized protein YdaU (DUF1376 family)